MVACLADKNTLHWVLALGRLNAVCTSKANLNNYDTQIGKWPLTEYSTNEQGSTIYFLWGVDSYRKTMPNDLLYIPVY